MFITIAVIVHFNHHTFHIVVVIYVQLQFSHQDPRYMHRHPFGLLVRQPVVMHTQAHRISHLDAV